VIDVPIGIARVPARNVNGDVCRRDVDRRGDCDAETTVVRGWETKHAELEAEELWVGGDRQVQDRLLPRELTRAVPDVEYREGEVVEEGAEDLGSRRDALDLIAELR